MGSKEGDDMHSEELDLKHKLASLLSKSWKESSEEKLERNWRDIEVVKLDRLGATSRQFVVCIPKLGDGYRKLFVKQYSSHERDRCFWNSQLYRDFEVMKALSQWTRDRETFKVVRPYFVIPDELILVTKYIEGENLSYLFSRALRFSRLTAPSFGHLHRIVGFAGNALAELQSLNRNVLLDLFGQQDMEDYITKILLNFDEAALYLNKAGFFSDLVEAGMRSLQSVIGTLKLTDQGCFQHTDFMLGNLLVDGQGRLFLFDFPNAGIGLPYFDVAHFITSLEDLSYLRTVSEKHVQNLVKSFLIAYGAKKGLDPLLLDGFRLYFQFCSTVIILKSGNSRRSIVWRLFHKNTLKRFRKRVSTLLERIEKGNGELT